MSAIRKACVIGDPVAHSRSPLIHGHWLRTLGIDGAYERAHVKPDDLTRFIRAMPDAGYVGANVTVPHKEAVLALCDEASDRARAIGAANTIWFDGGRLCADNTDGAGFLAHLDATHADWRAVADRVVVLGAGGAARGVLHALLSRGVETVTLANRSLERAARLAEDMGKASPARIVPRGWRDLPGAMSGAGLLVNTTSLGMAHQPPLDCPLDGLRADAIVDDIVYVPLETDLLRRARARGLRAVDGLGMLLHQAAPGFERWFGVKPAVTPELRALIVADIERSA